MPTLKRFGAVSIKMYADDHNPPHFHIVGPDVQVLVRIDDLRILAGNAGHGIVGEPLAWAADHREVLMQTWIELSERG